MKIPFLFSDRFIDAGPFDEAPDTWEVFKVKLTNSSRREADIFLDIPDFGIPKDDEAVRRALKAVLLKLARKVPVYVGCGAGLGRTGLFLALLVRVMGVDKPIHFVRFTYDPKAVETSAQHSYVYDFDLKGFGWFSFKVSLVALWVDIKSFFSKGG